jgi:hypothetical protein
MISGFYPTLPPGVARYVDYGKLHFVQAHLLAKEHVSVHNWYKNRGASAKQGPAGSDIHRDHCVVLDNGAWELGKGDGKLLMREALVISPDVIIVPDAFRDCTNTLRLARAWVDSCAMHAPEIMVVPQGTDLEEWCDCALELYKIVRSGGWEHSTILGLPKILETYSGGRKAAVVWCRYRGLFPCTEPHALGIWYDLGEAKQLWEGGYIGSLDSTLPYACAKNEDILYLKNEKVPMKDEWWHGWLGTSTVTKAQINIAIAKEVMSDGTKGSTCGVRQVSPKEQADCPWPWCFSRDCPDRSGGGGPWAE